MDKKRLVRKVQIVMTIKDFGSNVLVTSMALLFVFSTGWTRLDSLAWYNG